MSQNSPDGISGEDAFRLHDTYGFPLELTRELALERGLPVDEDGFEQLMAGQRDRSRAGKAGELERAAEFAREAGFVTEFVGYEKTEVLTQLGALERLEGDVFLAKLRESPFYPEGGGQVSDQGFVERETGERVEARAVFRLRGRPGAALRRGRASRRRPGQSGRPVVGSLPDDGEPHRDPSAAPRAA